MEKDVGALTSSSDIDNIKIETKKVQNIVDQGFDENSILGHLQDKVNEVIKLKEELLEVKAQLKLQKETNQLMDAEFAFRKQEYENEIEKLRENEAKLQEMVLSKTQETQKINVEAIVSREKEKFETEKKGLQEKISNLQQTISSLKSSSSAQLSSDDLTKLTSNYQSKIDRRNKKIEQLVALVNEKENELSEKDDQINQMKNELSSKDSIISELQSSKSQASIDGSTPVVIEKLKGRLSRAKQKIEEMKQIEQQNKKLCDVINHYDTEREVISDLLHAHDEDGRKEWTNLRAKAKECANAANDLLLLRQKLEKTEAMLTQTQSSMQDANQLEDQLTKEKERVKSLLLVRDQLSNMQIENNALKAQNETVNRFQTVQEIRTKCAIALNKSQKEITDSICGLHSAIFKTINESIRPVVLMTFFLTRWKRMLQNKGPAQIDPMALVAFTSSSGFSIEQKIKEIQDEYLRLTNEVIQTKALLAKSEEKRVALKQIVSDQQAASEAGYNKLKREKEISSILKKRMNDLQRELSLLTPSDRFEELKTKCTELEIENERLKNELSQLEQITGDQALAVSELRTRLIEAEASSHHSNKEMQRMKDIAEKREREADILESRLKEKTRDMLALERFAVQVENNPFKKGLDKSSAKITTINGKFTKPVIP